MNLYNATPFATGYTLGLQKSGRNCLVLVAKATYTLPTNTDEKPSLAEEQIPPYETDTYTGEPGYSAPIYENDYPPYKPKCDVILNGSAYAPQGKPCESLVASLQIGGINKHIHIIGPRHWKLGVLDGKASKPEPFSKQTISYDTAYGGTDPIPKKHPNDDQLYSSLMTNPIGIGYYPHQNPQQQKGKPLPQTEAIDQPVKKSNSKKYTPQSFGGIARNWSPRAALGGTYDDHWSEHIKPFLPEDFDEHYYQFAPKDQQIDYLKGGETLVLRNLTPQGQTQFKLPSENIPMQAILSNGERHNLVPVIDTLSIDTDAGHFTLVWRARIGLKRNVHEVDTLIIGQPTKGWERARMMDKLYLPLEQLNAFIKRMIKQLEEEQRLRDLADKKAGEPS